MILAAAQTIPYDEDVTRNIKQHIRLVKKAARHGAQVVLFPEMSLTGYLRATAHLHAFTPNDARLKPLRQLASEHNIVIVAGAPVKLALGLHIGALILNPNDTVQVYTKHFLHEGEEQYFTPGSQNPMLVIGKTKLALAICADINHPEHARQAFANGAAAYLPGIFYTPNGLAEGYSNLQHYASSHAMPVLMANYGGPSHGWASAGQSAFWDETGRLQASLDDSGTGLLLAKKQNGVWQAQVVPDEQYTI